MESQKIINVLEPNDNNEKYFQTKKWYIINDQINGQYNENSTIKFDTEVIKENICDYGDAYILVTGDIKIIGGATETKFCFKDTPFIRNVLHLNDTHIETSGNLKLVMKHYNLIEYSDNYQDTVGSLHQFKRAEQPMNNDVSGDVDVGNSDSFKYRSSLLTRLNSEACDAGANPYRTFKMPKF